MPANKIIFFDNAATTAIFDDVLDTYVKAKKKYFGNPSSIHICGEESSRILNKSREQILSYLGLDNHQVVFTSGATESNNLAIKGYALKHQNRGKHIITSNMEHPSVLETVKQLHDYFGFDVTYLNPNEGGIINPQSVKAAIRKDTILVSLMMVNNEIGSINPIEEIGVMLKQYPLIGFHVDGTQGIGKIKMSFKDVDMLSFSGHKIHGTNNSGALILRNKIELLSINSGGGQENNIRSGTNDVAGSIALAKAIRLNYEKIDENYAKVKQISDILVKYLKDNAARYEINGCDNPYIINFSTLRKKASVLVEALSSNGVMVSSTSACHAREEPISYVVKALGKSDELAHNTIRVSLSSTNTVDEMNEFIKILDRLEKELK